MTRSRLRRALLGLAAATTAAATLLSGCAQAPGDTAGNSHDTAGGGGSTRDLTEVSFALDWEPNTNHLALYTAKALGYFEDAGISVKILPNANIPVIQLVSAGEADFGFDGQSSVQMANAAGTDVKAVFVTSQTESGAIVARGDRTDLRSPKDLDGKIFGGFGLPLFVAVVKGAIQGDGGKGDFTEVTAGTGAYEALKSGRVDFTLSVRTWESIQAELDGHPYREWRYQDYGVPDQQSGVVVTSNNYLSKHRDIAKKFIAAYTKGQRYAAEHPEKAARLLIKENPDTLSNAKELVTRSAKMMATEGFLRADGHPVGAFQPKLWEEHGKFLFKNRFLVDRDGKPLRKAPDWRAAYTDELLPKP